MSEATLELFHYEKLNSNHLLPRLTTDIRGQALHEFLCDSSDGPGLWRWILT